MTDRDTRIVDALSGIAYSSNAPDVLASIRVGFPGSTLYAVDHAFTALVPIGDDESTAIPLRGALYESIAAAESLEDADFCWTPLPDGRFPLFVLRQDQRADPIDPWLRSMLGVILGRHLDVMESLESPRRRSDMTVASHLQWSQVRSRADRLGGYEVAGTLEPAYEVAGDMFDFALNPAGQLTIFSLDAMGHGQTATLSAALALAAIRNARLGGADLVAQMTAADAALVSEWGGDRFTTIVGLEVHEDALAVVNAGHEPLRMLGTDETTALGLQADPPAGVGNGARYRLQELPPLQFGETLVMLSDGASDARNSEGSVFGPDRIIESLSGHRGLDPLPLVHRFVQDLLAHSPEHGDDITAVALRRAPPDD